MEIATPRRRAPRGAARTPTHDSARDDTIHSIVVEAHLSSKVVAFLIASVILAIVPGPAVIYLVTQTLARGRRAGLGSVAGIAVGNLMSAAVASLGLAALLAASAAAFLVIKIAGAAYLVFLGLKALRSRPQAGVALAPEQPVRGRFFRDAVIVAFLNPKTALFFAALLPQFVDPRGGSALVQNLIFGSIFVAVALCTDTTYVMAAAGLRTAVGRQSRWARLGRYLSAATFIALGVYAALASPRSTR
jgi:threonine/homoserine/homoserine lactone efflux protein